MLQKIILLIPSILAIIPCFYITISKPEKQYKLFLGLAGAVSISILTAVFVMPLVLNPYIEPNCKKGYTKHYPGNGTIQCSKEFYIINK